MNVRLAARKMRRLVRYLIMAAALPAASPSAATIDIAVDAYQRRDYVTAFGVFRSLAEAGDADAQNIVGHMLFYGRGTVPDPGRAHEWFHLAAEQDHVLAQRNLGILHTNGAEGVQRDYAEAEMWFAEAALVRPELAMVRAPTDAYRRRRLERLRPLISLDASTDDVGEKVFLKFCAGCHGFNGFAFYPPAPSFALGERMWKDDATLLQSVLNGKNAMPGWRDKLPEAMLIRAIRYVRTLAIWSKTGLRPRQRPPPELFYIFQPVDEGNPYWYFDILR